MSIMAQRTSAHERMTDLSFRPAWAWLRLLSEKKQLLLALALFAAAFALRLYRINEPPLNYHAVRQYHSLLIARGYYYESQPNLPAWQRELALLNKERQGIWEPHFLEVVTASGYLLLGQEAFWIPRSMSVLFWLLGGAFLFAIARRLGGAGAALVSLSLYLFFPFGVVASRSVQPDPLMVMGVLASVYLLLRYYETLSEPRLLAAALVSALAILVKFVGVFPIWGAFFGMGLASFGMRRLAFSRHSALFLVISLLPAGLFYGYQVFFSGSLMGVARGNILPQLLLQPFFWRGWLAQVGEVTGYAALTGALLGLFLFSPGLPRGLILGLWAGYLLFGLVFTYTIHTHDYWNLMLLPIAALSAGPLGARLVELVYSGQADQDSAVRGRPAGRSRQLALGSVLVLALAISAAQAWVKMANPGYAAVVSKAERIGDAVNHSTQNVFLASDYGLSLEYHGQLSGEPWPLVSDLEWERMAGQPVMEAETRFNRFFSDQEYAYFIVVDRVEYDGQPDLQRFLMAHYPLRVETADFLLFDLRAQQEGH
jgi:hypothetical protein